ncbi:PadR family transcriptional regulator [Phytoactinopolyspora mesophila]|uniref:PadR family transcriptional regulator n=1 Tax=Phytoactinopolyspora mesophila TaxID=2650750 RepID=A0A7K3M1J0_9ACTN|nr:helix-turn-helix transcriptional regulator [Phytoactinopolyspora mesophila]NDL57110.1 PadR family transcriptional regulator [Phytoactinopolyspora mesophila]
MKSALLKGHLDAMLLATLEPGPLHGYGVVEELRARSEGTLDLPSGTIYPALHRLERSGLIHGDWSVHNGRRRRTYTITTAGRAALAAQRTEWRGFANVVERVIGA